MAVIRVSGNAGSGKTTLCKKLAVALNYEYSYTGGIFRAMAEERGQTIEEFYVALAADPALEKSVDERQEALMLSRDNLVVEGRIAPFLKCAFHTVNVKVTVGAEMGARRLLLRRENWDKSLEEMLALTVQRYLTERARYRALYNIEEFLADRHFDILIDTTGYSKDKAFEALLSLLLPRLAP